jgi:monofunctional biosynthetic peptidoglycan transglycosylase
MRQEWEWRLKGCGADPNTTLLLAATGGYKAVGMAIQAAMGVKRPAKNRHPWPKRIGLVVLLIMAGLLLSIIAFRFINPPVTSVMIAEKLKGAMLKHRWVPLVAMARDLPLAVIASEDGSFCVHWGVDWAAVKDAVEEAKRRHRSFRGASTITMQTAKNLYLFTDRSYVRKVLEVPLAYLLTLFWPKERVIEVYLNIAQWGPGIFGAEAASQQYFHKSAAELTRREALLLAAALPNPLSRNPAKPSPRMLRIAKSVERRMPILAARSSCVAPQINRQSTSGQRRG